MLDVFEQEPLPAKSVFEGIPNVILTPHIAGVTKESNARISQMTADNVCAVLASRSGVQENEQTSYYNSRGCEKACDEGDACS